MSAAGADSGEDRRLFFVDVSWRNFVFSLRTAGAAILALAIVYWGQLSEPQWATLTVYLLAQPTVGATLAKGVWRALGTVVGGALGLGLVGLFSQAPEVLVGVVVLLVGASFYVGARLRNFASYGVLLGGYTMLLVAYEGSSDPVNAWSTAADRIGAILIGVACGALASAIVLPRYAADALAEARADAVSGLARYVATALRLSTPVSVFAHLRARMAAEVVSFDALRSYTMFERPELRIHEDDLLRLIREFLVLLAVARGLFVRIEEFDKDDARPVLDRLRPTLEAIAKGVERIAADPAARRDTRRLRRELLGSRGALKAARLDLEAMAGAASLEPLVDGLLILDRVGELLRRLALVVVVETSSLRPRHSGLRLRRYEPPDSGGRREPRTSPCAQDDADRDARVMQRDSAAISVQSAETSRARAAEARGGVATCASPTCERRTRSRTEHRALAGERQYRQPDRHCRRLCGQGDGRAGRGRQQFLLCVRLLQGNEAPGDCGGRQGRGQADGGRRAVARRSSGCEPRDRQPDEDRRRAARNRRAELRVDPPRSAHPRARRARENVR